MALKKVKLGDVFQLKTTTGYAYFQCAKEAPAIDSEIIRVFNVTFESVDKVDFKQLLAEKEAYLIQFPIKYALKKNIVEYIGNYQLPQDFVLPRYYRTTHIIKGEFKCWHIVDSETLERRSISNLSDEEMMLSPWGMWNDTLLVERIVNKWELKDWK